jgi:hypothetical protein
MGMYVTRVTLLSDFDNVRKRTGRMARANSEHKLGPVASIQFVCWLSRSSTRFEKVFC